MLLEGEEPQEEESKEGGEHPLIQKVREHLKARESLESELLAIDLEQTNLQKQIAALKCDVSQGCS